MQFITVPISKIRDESNLCCKIFIWVNKWIYSCCVAVFSLILCLITHNNKGIHWWRVWITLYRT